jgi:hypothetical protein
MAFQLQAGLIGEIAALFSEYRAGGEDFVKFGMKCGLALNRLPIAGGFMMAPKVRSETFQIADPAYREHHPTEKDAFCAAFDAFTSLPQFLAWNGKVGSTNQFDLLKVMSDNFTRPTMTMELVYRRRGEPHEQKLSMFFIGFPTEAEAWVYAGRHVGQVM